MNDLQQLIDSRSRVFESTTLTELTAWRLGGRLQELLDSLESPKLTSLTLGYCLRNEQARAIASSPYLANLKKLELWSEIGGDGAEAIAGSPHLSKLTKLKLSPSNLGSRGAQAIARSPHLANLTILDLEDSGIGNQGARAIARSPQLANLTELNLNLNGIGAMGAEELAASPYLLLPAKLSALRSARFDAIADQVERGSQSRYTGR
ncbi:hypothetical protein [Fimbriiglobus ruber]|uniref:hypothetical protein n=1 Tax=Fimbriiglobus ruber TaxID=1908690 RepID=UPI0011799E49